MAKCGSTYIDNAYSDICRIYEESFPAHYQHVWDVLSSIINLVPAQSKVLDVGSGTGRPVSEFFVNKGYGVTGVDLSTGMIELARRQVPDAKFIQSDMNKYAPPTMDYYDIIVASHSLYNLSVAKTFSMLLKFARWVKPGGVIVIGTSYRRKLIESDGFKFDHRGWAEGVSQDFLGYIFDDMSYGLEDAWSELISQAGFEILNIDKATFTRDFEDVEESDTQFYISARRIAENPLLGLNPLPESSQVEKEEIDTEAWSELYRRSNAEEVNKVVQLFETSTDSHKILCIAPRAHGNALQALHPDTEYVEIDIGNKTTAELESIEFPTGTFDGVILSWTLNRVTSLGPFLKRIIETATPNGNAKVVIIQAAPDNELICITKNAFHDLPGGPIAHHGVLLQQGEIALKRAGFTSIRYVECEDVISFGELDGEERIKTSVKLLSRLWRTNFEVQTQPADRLINAIKLQFNLYRLWRNIQSTCYPCG
ncbi:hypothetical protein M422DRAFT_178294 [Sphaerobolus stellatus SS14]|uniref:Methyltransferase domain-containing protein n=1 Tax=Sphaerobolus stellatus (strain SS14) TaxID=990650 RepID=A0A0C9VIW4_SPHS4|nr:hypothetical protein M422DRAFT_178294 [Sphaerobolus stellatus SS14]